MNLDLFKNPTLTDLARELELHPFEAVRILSQDGPLPAALRFGEVDLERLRRLGGLEQWWTTGDLDDDASDAARLTALATKLCERGLAAGGSTRMDNLHRGLTSPHRERVSWLARRLLQRRILTARAAAAGMHVSVGEGGQAILQRLAEGGHADQELPGFWEREAQVIELSLDDE